jgi:hypothetical protein
MPYIGMDRVIDEDRLKSYFNELEKPFSKVKKVKRQPFKKREFRSYSKKIEDAYNNYMSTKAYEKIQSVIEETLNRKRDKVLFHESNACPEFWEQTRIVGGINIAKSLLKAAQSLLEA